jgi:acetyl-CoA C-acetyltransferase
LKPEFPGVGEPRTGKSMGQHCELMAREWQIARADQDALAAASHRKAAAAYDRGFFDDLVVPFRGVTRDTILRADTSVEKLATLKPAFDKISGLGTLTAGNSTPLTDGASAVLLGTQEWAQANGLKVQAWLVDAQVAAVDFVHGDGLLMAPAWAVPQMLARHGLRLQDFDFYEIHEAFAAQVLCTLRAWESDSFCRDKLGLDGALGSIDPDKLNVVGSSLAFRASLSPPPVDASSRRWPSCWKNAAADAAWSRSAPLAAWVSPRSSNAEADPCLRQKTGREARSFVARELYLPITEMP